MSLDQSAEGDDHLDQSDRLDDVRLENREHLVWSALQLPPDNTAPSAVVLGSLMGLLLQSVPPDHTDQPRPCMLLRFAQFRSPKQSNARAHIHVSLAVYWVGPSGWRRVQHSSSGCLPGHPAT